MSNPADASHVIDNPGFNVFLPGDKWVSADVDWYGGYNGSGWCCAQSGGQSTDMSLIQEIPAGALPSGVYEVECQGLYRNSDHRGQASAEAVSHAALVAGADAYNIFFIIELKLASPYGNSTSSTSVPIYCIRR